MTNEHDHQRKPSDHENMQVALHLNARRVPRTTGQSFQGMAKKIFEIEGGGNTIPISNDSSSGNHLTSLYIQAASLCRHPFSAIVSKLPVLTITRQVMRERWAGQESVTDGAQEEESRMQVECCGTLKNEGWWIICWLSSQED